MPVRGAGAGDPGWGGKAAGRSFHLLPKPLRPEGGYLVSRSLTKECAQCGNPSTRGSSGAPGTAFSREWWCVQCWHQWTSANRQQKQDEHRSAREEACTRLDVPRACEACLERRTLGRLGNFDSPYCARWYCQTCWEDWDDRETQKKLGSCARPGCVYRRNSQMDHAYCCMRCMEGAPLSEHGEHCELARWAAEGEDERPPPAAAAPRESASASRPPREAASAVLAPPDREAGEEPPPPQPEPHGAPAAPSAPPAGPAAGGAAVVAVASWTVMELDGTNSVWEQYPPAVDGMPVRFYNEETGEFQCCLPDAVQSSVSIRGSQDPPVAILSVRRAMAANRALLRQLKDGRFDQFDFDRALLLAP